MADREWLIDNGCELTKPDIRMFMAIYEMSHGNPCRECNCKSTCPAWKKMQSGSQTPRRHGSGNPVCPTCSSPMNMEKVRKRGGKCACGAVIGA